MDVILGGRSIVLTKVELVRTISMERGPDRLIVMERSPERVLQLTGVGLQGVQGIQGEQGVQGIQGLKGDKGDQGDKGDTGERGPVGATGEQGVQGIQGLKGDTGDQGLKGDKGDTGEQGIQGIQGEQGLQGLQGIQGIQGLKGDAGDPFVVDELGPLVERDQYVGEAVGFSYLDVMNGNLYFLEEGGQWGPAIPFGKGEKGDQGDQGVQGPQGLQGDQGIPGPQGLQGLQGPVGAKGDKGDTGNTGAQGIQGIQGPQGLKGDTGAQGIQGIQGVKGDTGSAASINDVQGLPAALDAKASLSAIHLNGRQTNFATLQMVDAAGTGRAYLYGDADGSGFLSPNGGGWRFRLGDAASYFTNALVYAGGNLMLHTANVGSYALPITGGALTGNLTLSNGANRSINIGSATNYSWTLATNGDNFEIREAGDPAKARLKFVYPTGNAIFQADVLAKDFVSNRGNGTGAYYFGADTSRYIYFNGSEYLLGGLGRIWTEGHFNIPTVAATANTPVLRDGAGDITTNNLRAAQGRKGLVGVYSAANTQAIFAMGADYQLSPGNDPLAPGGLYGLAWSYNPNYAQAGDNPQSKAGLNHQMLLMQNGITTFAAGSGMWTTGNIESSLGNLILPAGSTAQAGTFYCTASDGTSGFRLWGNDDTYSIYMRGATGGGRMVGETSSDYNIYFSNSGGARGWNFKSGGSVVAGLDGLGQLRVAGGVAVAYDSGFKTRIGSAVRNKIWSFVEYDQYGLSYFQGTAGWASQDTIGIHFGDASTIAGSSHRFRADGRAYHSGGAELGGTTTLTNVTVSGTCVISGGADFNGGLVYNSNWWRSTGSTGWFNATHSTGIYSVQGGEVRTYNGANFYSEGSLSGGAGRMRIAQDGPFVTGGNLTSGAYNMGIGTENAASISFFTNNTLRGSFGSGGDFSINGNTIGSGFVRAASWFYSSSVSTGWYNEASGRGMVSADQNSSYGQLAVYGAGLNGWNGISFSTDNKSILMANGSTWGVYNPAGGVWMMQSDYAGNMTFAGNVTAYSDLRLKDVISGITNAKERRDNLAKAAIIYRRNDGEDDRIRVGLGAQTLRDGANPELVHEADDARKAFSPERLGTLSVDYGEGVAILAVASKETDDELAAVKAELAEVKRLLQELLAK